jgi:integrase/recombinase XerD
MVKRFLQKIKKGKLSTHKLRATFATLALGEFDVDIRTLQEMMGHTSISTTQLYTSVLDKNKKRAAEIINI